MESIIEKINKDLNYKELQAPFYLNKYVQYFWKLGNGSSDLSSKVFGPLVDGYPGLIIQLSATGGIYDEQGKQLPNAFLYGQTVKLTKLYLIGDFDIIGVRFFPNVLKPLFKLHPHELTDSCVEADLLPGIKNSDLMERLCEARLPDIQVELLSSYLARVIEKHHARIDAATQYALTALIQSKGNVSLRHIQKELKLSERSFERRFEQHVGIPPKLYSRICRFQASLNQLKQSNFSRLSDIAFDNGYADQSHFIRTFKQFSGYAPREFRNQYYASY